MSMNKFSSQVFGISWKLFSCLSFALTNVLVRYLSGGSSKHIDQVLSTYTIIFWQNFFGALIVFLVHYREKQDQKIEKTNHYLVRLHFLRILIAVIGVGLWYMSLRYFIISQAVALSFIAPALIVIAAIVVLDEKISLMKGLAITSSLVGGFIIARPDLQLSTMQLCWQIILPITAQLLFNWNRIITRQLLQKGAEVGNITLYLLGGMSLFAVLPSLYYGWEQPTIKNLLWLLTLSIFGVSAHFSFAKAYYYAEVTYLFPFGISRLLFSSIAGFIIFNEFPQFNHVWLGIVIIACSIFLLEPMKKHTATN